MSTHRRLTVLPLVAVVGLALALRSPISSLAVVLPEAQRNLSLSAPVTSLLTALPVLCFAAVGLWLGPRLGRFGLHRAAVVVLTVMAVGVLARSVAPSGAMLLASTLVVLAAIAAGNVLVPAVAKAHFPDRIALVSSIFGAAIIGGSTLGALQGGWTESVWGWRAALAGVAVLLGVTIVVWLPLVAHDRKVAPPGSDLTVRQIARVGAVWPLVMCFGLVSAQAYAQLGWYPAILRDARLTSAEAAGAFAVLTGVGIPTMLSLAALTRLLGDRGAIPCSPPPPAWDGSGCCGHRPLRRGCGPPSSASGPEASPGRCRCSHGAPRALPALRRCPASSKESGSCSPRSGRSAPASSTTPPARGPPHYGCSWPPGSASEQWACLPQAPGHSNSTSASPQERA